jgi:thioredoxin-related protein
MKKILILLSAVFISTVAFSQVKNEPVHIYNPEADAKIEIKNAIAKASKDNKHVFVQVGGNWCTWCIAFHNLVERDTTLKNYLNNNYETVLLNYSKENKNLDVLESLGNPQRFGFPVFLVLDKLGKVLHIENSAYLETSELDEKGKTKVGHDSKKVIAFLQNWTVKATDPETYKEKTK